MVSNKHITHEFLSKKFSNQFELVKVAISRAQHRLEAGVNGSELHPQNITTLVLNDMEKELKISLDESLQ